MSPPSLTELGERAAPPGAALSFDAGQSADRRTLYCLVVTRAMLRQAAARAPQATGSPGQGPPCARDVGGRPALLFGRRRPDRQGADNRTARPTGGNRNVPPDRLR
jgi:hypothetical protein